MDGRIPDRILWQRTKHMGDYIGGAPKVGRAEPPAFEDLPALLRSIIDQQAYASVCDRIVKDANTDAVPNNHDLFLIWQVRQLAAWLGE